MAFKVGSTTHINSSGQLQNISSLDTTTASTIGAAGGGVVPSNVEILSNTGYFGSFTRNATAGTYYIALGGANGAATSANYGTPTRNATVTTSSGNSQTHRGIFWKFT